METLISKKIKKTFEVRKDYTKAAYIDRPEIESRVSEALDRYKYVFVTGDSGSGKTWLISHILESQNIESISINMATVKRKGGFEEYFKSTVTNILVETEESIDGQIGVAFAGIKGTTSNKFVIQQDFFEMFLKENKGKMVLLDNFESIVNDEKIVDELSSIITMADDKMVVESDISFIVIGTNSDILKYFENMPNYQTIENRIQVIKIKGFNDTECYDYVSKRFRTCEFSIPNTSEVSLHILDRTDGLPQCVAELCYRIAMRHFKENVSEIRVSNEAFLRGEKEWVDERMRVEVEYIHHLYNINLDNAEERNHVLYALATYPNRDFTYLQLYSHIEAYAQKNVIAKTAVKSYLEELSNTKANKNLLVGVGKDRFRFKSYRTYACLKDRLFVDENMYIMFAG